MLESHSLQRKEIFLPSPDNSIFKCYFSFLVSSWTDLLPPSTASDCHKTKCCFDEDVYTSFGKGFILMKYFSHLYPHSPYKKQRRQRNKKLHHPLRCDSHVPCHLVRGAGLGAKLRAGWANILKVTGMSSLMLRMRKRCPGNAVCVCLIQKDGSNLYWTFTELSACIYVSQPVSLERFFSTKVKWVPWTIDCLFLI